MVSMLSTVSMTVLEL